MHKTCLFKFNKFITSFGLAASLVAVPVSAQSSFEGFFGQIGVGYVKNDTSNTAVTASSSGSSYTLNPTGSNPHRSNFTGVLSLGYYASLNPQFLLGVGIEYEPLIQTTSSYTVAAAGQASQNGSYKISNRYNIFVSPGLQVSKEGMAYAKVGFTGQAIQGNSGFLSNLSAQNQSGYSLGLGYRQLFDQNLYAFIEANYFNYGKQSASFTSGSNSYTVNPSASAFNGLIGIGYKF